MFLFTDRLQHIFEKTKHTGNRLNIRFELVAKQAMAEEGLCFLNKHGHRPHIEIKIREDRLNEEVVSHELLHALSIQKGFGQTNYNHVEGIPLQQIGVLLHSVIEHKLIYSTQLSLGIDRAESQKHMANTIFKNVDREPPGVDYSFVVNALILLDCLIGAGLYQDLFINRIKQSFPRTYELALRLEGDLFPEDIDDAAKYRRAFIKGLKICDDFLRQNLPESTPHVKLSENISISYIPSAQEKQQPVKEVFIYRETENNYIILSIKEAQACYVVDKSNRINDIMNMSVAEFISNTDRVTPQP